MVNNSFDNLIPSSRLVTDGKGKSNENSLRTEHTRTIATKKNEQTIRNSFATYKTDFKL